MKNTKIRNTRKKEEEEYNTEYRDEKYKPEEAAEYKECKEEEGEEYKERGYSEAYKKEEYKTEEAVEYKNTIKNTEKKKQNGRSCRIQRIQRRRRIQS